MRGVAQRAEPPPGIAAEPHEYAFLIGSLIDGATLERAEHEAAVSGVTTHAALIACGWISQPDYAAALAQSLGLDLALWGLVIDGKSAVSDTEGGARGLPALVHGHACRVLSATSFTPVALARHAARLRGQGYTVVLAPQTTIDAAIEARGRNERIAHAVRGLLSERPTISAGSRTRTWQIVFAAGVLGAAIGGVFVVPDATIAALTGLIALPFLCVTVLRLVALQQILRPPMPAARRIRAPAPRLSDSTLPIYSVLVPLLRESNVLEELVRSLRALDYPAAKLDIILVLETGDAETQAALLRIDLPGNFRTIIVPPQPPQTKPKALNYALQFARGEFVVVYDAEDRPEPGQLRAALEVFRHHAADLVCVQAQLNIYNPSRSWLTRGLMAQTP